MTLVKKRFGRKEKGSPGCVSKIKKILKSGREQPVSDRRWTQGGGGEPERSTRDEKTKGGEEICLWTLDASP